MRSLKLELLNDINEIKDIIEYAFGFDYLFIRTENDVISIDRASIKNAYRKYKDRWVKINIKKNRKEK